MKRSGLKITSLLYVSLALLLTLALVLSGCSKKPGSTSDAQKETADAAKPITLIVSSQQPQQEVINTGINYWATELEKRSNGRVKVNIQYSGTLGKQGTEIEMLQKGIADIAITSTSSNAEKLPAVSFVTVPNVIPGMDAGVAALEAVEKAGYFDKNFTEAGVKVLWWQTGESGRIFLTKKKVTKLEDLKGLKIGYPGGTYNKMMLELLGASPTGVGSADMYMSLSTGVIDGVLFPPRYVYDSKTYEVVKNLPLTITGFGSCNTPIMSKKTWDSLPADIQKIITDLNIEAKAKYFERANQLYSETYDKLRSASVDVYEFSNEENARWSKAVEPAADDWVKAIGAKGYPADKIMELVKSTVASQTKK